MKKVLFRSCFMDDVKWMSVPKIRDDLYISTRCFLIGVKEAALFYSNS